LPFSAGEESEKKKISKSHFEFSRALNKVSLALLAILILAVATWFVLLPREPAWTFSSTGILNYSKDRGNVLYDEADLGNTKDRLIKVSYDSRGDKIYGILRIPKREGEKVPGIVLLPGAGVTKETEQRVASVLSEMGYATLTIDQRGIGESTNDVGSLQSNYEIFRHGGEPPVHKMVYDALRAYDLLSGRSEVDPNKIVFMGESMGGRTAIIAAAIEQRAKGVVGMSTGGYGLGAVTPDNNLTVFQRSIDPDAYIDLISPRKVLMIHSSKDNVIPLLNSENTFSFAKEPKRFVNASCEIHGYCGEMRDGLETGLRWILETG
jgi:dienelactone hydrolase